MPRRKFINKSDPDRVLSITADATATYDAGKKRLYTNKPTTVGLMILARDWDRLDSIGPDRRKVVLEWMEDIDEALIFKEAVSNGMATNQEDTFIMGQFSCMAAGASFILSIDAHEAKRVMLMQLFQTNQAPLVEMEDASLPKSDPE